MKTDKKTLILDAAEQLMLSEETEDISINMIAQSAGIAKGGIYYYFEKKEEIIYAVIQRTYKRLVNEYLNYDNYDASGIDKLKSLFSIIIKQEFRDKEHNLILALHLKENTLIHNYLKLIAIQELSPILEKILIQCRNENIIHIDVEPYDVAEMLVAILTFFLDGTIFDYENSYSKLKMLSKGLNTCLSAEPGTFDFICDIK